MTLFDLDKLKSQASDLEKEIGQDDFWANQREAQKKINLFNSLNERIKTFDELNKIYNDLIETYLLQKQRGYVSYYGLKHINNIKDVKIIRPLLDYKKIDLLNYCKENKIPFSIDYTNDDINLKRNYLRKNIINNLNDNERKVTVYIDYTLTLDEGIIGVHSNDNTATVWLKTIDLIRIIKEHGNFVKTIEM